jgi:hypothetical protein
MAAVSAQAQPSAIYQPTDSLAVMSLLSRSQTLSVQTPAQRLAAVGRMLLGKPFGAKTLETSPERLVVNLRAFDCTTFLETALALSQTAATDRKNFDAYQSRLAAVRYRNGKTDDYTARLHYLTDWLQDKIGRGELEDVTAQLGGRPYEKPVGFMTKHPQLYPQLSDPRNLAAMQAVEKQLGAQKLQYIPKAEVSKTEARLQEGDIIAITTGTAGLDVVHVGLAVRQNGRIHLLHASADQGKVAVSKFPLAEYLQKNAKQTGIIVTRLR